jgi:hypothetical protein
LAVELRTGDPTTDAVGVLDSDFVEDRRSSARKRSERLFSSVPNVMATSHRQGSQYLPAIGLSWRSLPVVSSLYYGSDQDLGRLRIICRRRGRSLADLRASRTAAWDSSLSANASKVLSRRVLLPIAPRRHSAASTLRNSGEYILSTWPLLRLG